MGTQPQAFLPPWFCLNLKSNPAMFPVANFEGGHFQFFVTPAGFLRPLSIPYRTWSDIALDFVIGLPTSNGHTCIMTVMHQFSKAVHFIPLPKLLSAKETTELIVHVFKLHGLPRDIVSDRRPQFTLQF